MSERKINLDSVDISNLFENGKCIKQIASRVNGGK